jgi:glycosyltransferase involved in cell wall biosynthesis
MRILQVIGWLAERYGGPVSSITAMSRGLAARGHVVDIVTTDADGPEFLDVPIARPVREDGYRVIYFHLGTPQRFLVAPALGRYLWRHVRDYDIVHIHSLYRFPNLIAATAARHSGVPYVIKPHGSLEPVHRRRRKAWKAVYHSLVENRNIRGAAAIQYSSQKESEGSRIWDWMPPPFIVPDAVDTSLLRLQAEAGTCPAFPPGPRIVFLGRLTRYKGIDLLLDAFSGVEARFPTAQLVIAGPDSDGTGHAVSRRAEGMGLAHRVHLIGPIYGADRAALVRSSRAFALVSDSENFGVSAVEAMALGVPVVVSDQVGIQSLISDAGAGTVVQQEAGQVSAALTRYLGSETAAEADGARAATVVEQQFGLGVVAARLERMYTDILGGVARP